MAAGGASGRHPNMTAPGEVGLRLLALINARNAVLVAALLFFAATTLITPKFRTTTAVGRAGDAPSVSEGAYVERVSKLQALFDRLSEDVLASKQEMSDEAVAWGHKFEEERAAYAKNTHMLEQQLLAERAQREQDIKVYEMTVVEQEEQFEARRQQLLGTVADLVRKRDELLETVRTLHFEEEQSIERAHFEAVQACQARYEEMHANATQNCAQQLGTVEQQCAEIEQHLKAAVAANIATKQSADDVVATMQERLRNTTAVCDREIADRDSAFQQYMSPQFIEEKVAQLVGSVCAAAPAPVAPVACPAVDRHSCATVCADQVRRKAAEVERACRADDIESELYHYDVDYALHSSGASVVGGLTSATFLPPELRLSAMVQKGMESLGLEEYREVVPEVAGEVLLEGLGLRLGRGSPVDALTPDLSLGSCWPMKGRRGNFTIELLSPVTLTAISIDHVSKSAARDWSTAPRSFSLYAAPSREAPMSWLYDGVFAWEKVTTQRFPLPFPASNVAVITLAVNSNYGNPDYTCLYRLRAHGHAQP